ncbi:hypothetical protein, partial [Acinetobacter baumannii]|uniref:hypothetical protein n=1 Tax=Acinetobacter baumannii TaxID=470 RepID=UPI0031F3DA68
RKWFRIEMIPGVYPKRRKTIVGKSRKTLLPMPHGRMVTRVEGHVREHSRVVFESIVVRSTQPCGGSSMAV